MENKILQIMYKLSEGKIKYNLASKQVLDLFGVSGMFSSDKLEQAYKDDVRKKYSSVIADIYAEHHVSPFTDIEKHNEGIIKAMVDFAIFYKENS